MDNESLNEKLFYAAENGIPSEIDKLISKGAHVNAQNPTGRTPLVVALNKGHPQTATILIRAGANLNLADGEGFTPLMIAIQQEMDIEVYKILITNGCNVTLRNKYNETALHIAVKTSESTINGYIHENSECNPLIQMTIARTVELLELLHLHGCDVNARNKSNQIALHFTTRMPTCTKWLLEHGSDVDVIDMYGRTPLTVAEEQQSNEVVELLRNHVSSLSQV